MKKSFSILLLLALCMCATQAMAQFRNLEGNTQRRQHSNSIIDYLRFGGQFGLSFGTRSMSLQINPSVAYQPNEYFSAGVIGTFEYYKYDYSWVDVQSFTYGGGIFAEAYPLEFLNLHAEAQMISYKDYYNNPQEPDTRNEMPILIGAGYRRMISNRASINIMILWNINDTDGLRNNTTFNNPILRASLMF